ncbi:MAG: hypothetical protein ACI9EF_001188 [Pseudohongiellaceae bacterium]|jgi:hypothetical protein
MGIALSRLSLLAFVAVAPLAIPCSAQASGLLDDEQIGVNFPSAFIMFGGGRSENIDIGDCDNDGDFDVIVANGGDGANQANEIQINNGGIQGMPGTFANGTSTRFAGVPNDRSRDLEFADFDGD